MMAPTGKKSLSQSPNAMLTTASCCKCKRLFADGRFGDKYTFPRETPTSFKVAEAKGSNTRQGLPSLPFYTLEEIMLFLEQKKSMGNYVKVALAQRVGAVDHSDREVSDSLFQWA